MTIEETVKNTPMDQRPLLNHNGVTARMTDDEFADYLRAQQEETDRPTPGPTEAQRIADLEARLAAYENAYEEGVNNA